MKMVSIVHLLVVCAASLAASQVASPHFGGDVAKSMPVPKGWHIVAFTSPKGADAMPDKDGAAPPGQTVLNDLIAPTEAEEAAEALAAKGPQEDNELAAALGSSSQPAEPVAASATPVALSEAAPAEAANTETVDGLQIPSGYRVQGLTPGAAAPEAPAVAAPTQPAAPDNDQLPVPAGYRIEGLTPAAEAVASTPPAIAASQQPAPPAPAQSTAAAATATATNAVAASADLKVDGLQVPAGWKITSIVDDSTPDADSDSPAATPAQELQNKAQAAAVKAAAPTPQALAPATNLHESRPLTAAEKAGIKQFEALKSKATEKSVELATNGAKLATNGALSASRAAEVAATAAATEKLAEEAAAKSAAKEKQRLAQEFAAQETARAAQKAAQTSAHTQGGSFGDMIKAGTVERLRAGGNHETGYRQKNRPDSVEARTCVGGRCKTTLAEAPLASLRGPVDGTPGALDVDASVAVLEPVGASAGGDTAAAAFGPEGSVIDKVLHIVHPDNTKVPYVPTVALQHITSVECLTETIDNGGRPCKSEYEKSVEARALKAQADAVALKAQAEAHLTPAQALKAQADAIADVVKVGPPKARRTLLTKGSVHRQQSITKVSKAHHHVDVTQVISREPAQSDHHEEPVQVVHHEHHSHAEKPKQEPKQEKGSMADLVATPL